MLDVKQPKILMFDVIEGKILVFSVFEIPPSRPSILALGGHLTVDDGQLCPLVLKEISVAT